MTAVNSAYLGRALPGIVLMLLPALLHAAPLSPKEVSALKEYGNRNRRSLGTLLTPSRGRVSPEIRKTREHLEQMMERLAGKRLRSENVRVVINIYSTPKMNAFAASPKTMEREWVERDKSPWPIRRFLGFADDGKPIYELGLTAGILREAQYEDEIAFVLGHELTHILEHHIDPPEENLMLRQTYEVVADYEGARMAVAAGYSPESGTSILTRLYRKQGPNSKSNSERMTEAAIEDHHHEGLRLALAQGHAEKLSRSVEGASGRAMRPTPAYFNLKRPDRIALRNKDFTNYKTDLRALIEKYLIASDRPRWVDSGISDWGPRHSDPPELQRISNVRLTKEEAMEALAEGLETIRTSKTDPKNRVNAAFRLFSFLGPVLREPSAPPPAGLEHQLTLLLKAAQGPAGWKFAEFRAETKSGFHLGRLLETRVLQSALNEVYSSGPEYRKLVDALPELMSADAPDPQARTGLIYSFDLLSSAPASRPLLAIEKKNLIAYLKQREFDPERDKLLDALDRVRGQKSDPEFVAQIEEVLNPSIQKFIERRNAHATDPFKDPAVLVNPEAAMAFNQLTMADEAYPFPEQVLKKLDAVLLKMADLRIGQKNVRQADESFRIWTRLGARLASRLRSPETPPATKKKIVYFLAENLEPSRPLQGKGFEKEIADEVGAYLAGLNPREFVQLVGKSHASQNAELLGQALGRANEVESIEPTEAALKRFIEYARKHPYGPDDDSPLSRGVGQMLRDSIRSREINRPLTLLAFAGNDRKVATQIVGKLSFRDVEALTGVVRRLRQRELLLLKAFFGRSPETEIPDLGLARINSEAGGFLFEALAAHQDSAPDLAAWYRAFHTIAQASPGALKSRDDLQPPLEKYLLSQLEKAPPAEQRDWLIREGTASLLSTENLARVATRILDPKPPLPDPVQRLTEALKFEKAYPEAWERFRSLAAERFQIQPNQLQTVFIHGQTGPSMGGSLTEKASLLSTETREMSALLALTRNQPMKDQVDLIEYLMGRREKVPEFIGGLLENERHGFSQELIRKFRDRLSNDSILNRVLVADSFVAGPSSFIENPAQLDEFLRYLLRDVRPENQSLALELAHALLEAQGSTRSLALAYVLGQYPQPGVAQASREGAILRSLFEAYGVPGIKMGQYLAFTSELSGYRSALEALQDSALPLSYLQAVELAGKRMGGKWPDHYRIKRVLGSGSVNVAIEYEDLKSHKTAVMSIAREDIEIATEQDFARFNRFLKSLTRTPEGRRKYGYLLGLARIIKDSVRLEFDKQAALRMQKFVHPLYRREVDGWKVRTVEGYDASGMTLTMEKAIGSGARSVRANDPKTYASAMKALSETEFDLLMGIGPNGKPHPVPLHANPDFHDGQVLIDPTTRRVTIIDFGQAVPITNTERDFGVDLLRVISGAESPQSAARLLGIPSAETEVASLLAAGERMDRFVKLLSLLERSGKPVPISTVHWVLAVNRQIALGEKIHLDIYSRLRTLLLSRKAGLSQSFYNRLHLWIRALQRLPEGTGATIAAAAGKAGGCLKDALSRILTGTPKSRP